MLSTLVFFVVSLLVSLGLWWWTGDVARGVFIGVICGAAAAFAVGVVGTNTSDLGMDMIAEQVMPSRNTMLLLYSPTS